MQSIRYSYRISMKLYFPPKIFEKYSNIKFHENPSSGSQVVPCGLTDSQTDTTKLLVAFRNFGVHLIIYNSSVPASQRTLLLHYIHQLVLFWEIVSVYSANHTQHRCKYTV